MGPIFMLNNIQDLIENGYGTLDLNTIKDQKKTFKENGK